MELKALDFEGSDTLLVLVDKAEKVVLVLVDKAEKVVLVLVDKAEKKVLVGMAEEGTPEAV